MTVRKEQGRVLAGLIVKNLRDRYVGSSLGLFWPLITPVSIMLAVSFVFGYVFKSGIERFPLFVLSALLPWYFLINCVTESSSAMKRSSELFNQFMFPRAVIPAASASANFINFLAGFVVLLPVFVFFNPAVMRVAALLLPALALLYVFGLGISYLFSVAGVYCRDLPHILEVAIMFFFWMTPIFYPAEQVPVQLRGAIDANPGTCFVLLFREIIFSASPGSFALWANCTAFAACAAAAGYALYRKSEQDILKRL